MPTVTQPADDDLHQRLGSAEVRRLLEGFVRRRVPPGEVDDLVQTVLVDALEAPAPPGDEASLRRWVVGIARHKVADFHRRKGRAKSVELPDQLPGDEPPISAREWAAWAERHTEDDPDAQRTLDWMAREGGGEKLAHIAEDERLPATQVRQRVSRLRRRLKEQWRAELAAVAILLTLAFVAWRLLREPAPQAITPEPDVVAPPDHVGPAPLPEPPSAPERAAALRREALEACAEERWQPCLDQLDEARRLDPAGEAATEVQRARERANRGLAPAPDPSAVETSEPSKSGPSKTAPSEPSTSAPLKMPPAPADPKQQSTRPVAPSPLTTPSNAKPQAQSDPPLPTKE